MSRNESRLLKEARRKASRSELVRELAEDVTGAPRELRQEMPGFDRWGRLPSCGPVQQTCSDGPPPLTLLP